jgi:alanine dehydrogenase
MSALFDTLSEALAAHHPRFVKTEVELILGNDREIGRETRSQERRVGITPDQVRRLIALFERLHLRLRVLVVAGAGQRAGFSDAGFIEAGAEILTKEELLYHDGPPDVVHALKEPSTYEREILTPFCRIGALHTGDFGEHSGLAGLLEKRNVAIFDGSAIGSPADYRIPVRGSMSIFAGEIAAEWLGKHMTQEHLSGRAVVVGGGNAGQSCVRKLLEDSRVTEIHLLDAATEPERLAAIAQSLPADPRVAVHGIAGADHPRLLESLERSVGVIFAVARPGKRTPRVASVDALNRMAEHALIVDISIDEGGAVYDHSIRDSWTHERIIPHLTKVIGASKERRYVALPNMPRAYPGKASEAHGEVILPYLATLLYLAAREGGAKGVADYFGNLSLQAHNPDPREVENGQVLTALIQDLRHGLAFRPGRENGIVVEDIVANRAAIFGFLLRRQIPFELNLAPPRERETPKSVKAAFEPFEHTVRETLELAVDKGITCRVISHPGIDGTRTADAAQALGVDSQRVLKCLVYRIEPGRWVAAVCLGRKRIAEELLKEAVGCKELHLAAKEEVAQVTGHPPGGVPVIQVFGKVEAVYVSHEVLEEQLVFGSAGSEYTGMGFHPSVLANLGAHVVTITREDSQLRRNEKRVRELLHQVEVSIEADDDKKARKALEGVLGLLGS